MISNKTAATLFLITLNMQLVASTFGDTPKQNTSDKPTSLVKRRRRASRRGTTPKLQDITSAMEDVRVQENSTEETDISQGTASKTGETAPVLPVTTSTVENVLPVNNQVTTRNSLCLRLYYWLMEPIVEKFERLFGQKRFDEILKIRDKLKPNKLLSQIYPLVKTLDQYSRISGCLKWHKVVASFYVYGDMGIVKEVIVTKWTIGDVKYKHGGDLENAIDLALIENRHDRFIDLLKVRRDITAEEDEQLTRLKRMTNFETFVSDFLFYLAHWEGEMALKRFLTLSGDELRSENPDILDTLCQELVRRLKYQLREPRAKKLLIDLIGQPSLLTPVAFAEGFLWNVSDENRSAFLEYGWREAIEEGLGRKYAQGGAWLWRVMNGVPPTQLPTVYSPLAIVRDAALARYPTKQQKEEEWAEKNPIPNVSKWVDKMFTGEILSKVVIKIIVEYAGPTWIDV